jgi:hypothetical protein
MGMAGVEYHAEGRTWDRIGRRSNSEHTDGKTWLLDDTQK